MSVSLSGRRLRFALLCLLYALAAFFYIRYQLAHLPSDDRPAGLQLLPFIGFILSGTWIFFLLLHFLVGRIAGEYLFLLPILLGIGSFLGTLVLLLFHLPLAGPGSETPLLFGSLYTVLAILSALAAWRRWLRQLK